MKTKPTHTLTRTWPDLLTPTSSYSDPQTETNFNASIDGSRATLQILHSNLPSRNPNLGQISGGSGLLEVHRGETTPARIVSSGFLVDEILER